MAIADYTTPAEIRAALGVNKDELIDATVALPMFENALTLELYSIDQSFQAKYDAAKASMTTPQEIAFVATSNLFATYFLADLFTDSSNNFAPRTITDGKAMLQRQLGAEDPVTKAIKDRLADYRTKLYIALGAIDSIAVVSVQRVFMATARGVDPVTGV